MTQPVEERGVGASIPRVDGAAKVTGRALYLDDITVPGMQHGATVRSQVPHGVLRAIRRDPDFDWTGITVVTAEDIPGRNTILLLEDDQPALVPVGGHVRHPDEPVALVAAPDRRRAVEAAAHIHLDVDELPAVLSIEDALAADIKLYGDDNVFKRFEIRKGDDIEEALAACDLVIEGTYRTGAQEQMYIEPNGALAVWDEGGKCRVTGSLQCPFFVHKSVKVLLGLSDDDLVIAQSVTGGAFGGKEDYPSMIGGHAALLARKAGAPVKLVYDREEDLRATTKRHPSRIRHRLGLSQDGTILAADVDAVLDGGAYVTLSPVVLSRGVIHAGGPYNCPHVRIVGRAVATNTPPHGAFRGFGAPQTTFAYERQVQKAARRLGIDPVEFRRKNLLREGGTTATGQELTYSVGSHSTLEEVARVAGEPPVEAAQSGGRVLRRGRGFATYFHGAGFTGSGERRLAGKVTVELAPDGAFDVLSASTEMGQGEKTTFTQIAATTLGVAPAQIRVPDPSTDTVPDSGPTVASRTCMIVGYLVKRAAQALGSRIEAWARERGMDVAMEDAARAMAAEVGRLSESAQYEAPPGIFWDDETYTGAAYPAYGWAACMIDVAVDMDTYEVTVERCVHAVDVGKAIHPVIVKGQIEGGTLQALGWALMEEVAYENGRVANPSMSTCIVPTFADAPEMETIIVEEPYPFGPYGAKGLGELPMDGPGAAVAAAIENALDAPFDELPVLPELIERTMRAGRES